MAPLWKFVLGRSSDLSNIGPLQQARSRSISLALNKAGTGSFTYPMTGDLAGEIDCISTCLKAYRKNTLIWSGPIWSIDEDPSGSGLMTIGSVGWQTRFEKRMVRRDKIWFAQDDGTIIFDLLDEMNMPVAPDGYAIPIVAGSSPYEPTLVKKGAKLPNEGAGGATPYIDLVSAGAGRNKNMTRYTMVGPEIDNLTQLENGCDIEITPDTRTLNIYRKKMKVTSSIFGYGWGPFNLSQFSRSIDASTTINYVLSTGRSTSSPGFGDDPESQAGYGLLEEVASLSDIQNTDILTAFANAEVGVRRTPRISYTLTPFPYTEGGRVPEPFVDYNLGDVAFFGAIKLPRIAVSKQAVRVFGITASIDDEGNEKIGQLQVTA